MAICNTFKKLPPAFIVLIIGLAIAMSASAKATDTAVSAQTADQSMVPLNNGLKALQDGRFPEAERWFKITARDFPKKANGLKALVLQLLYCGANELSHVRVARYLHDRGELELKDKTRWKERSEFFEQRAIGWGEKMVVHGEQFIARDGQAPLSLKFSLDLKGLDIEKLRSRLGRGEYLDDREMQRLTHGEWLRNYVGYMRETLRSDQGEIDFSGLYSATVNRPAFYRAFGVRFFIVGTKAKNHRALILSRRFFDRVIALTKDKPYDHDRQQAIDFLARLDDIPGSKQTEKTNEGSSPPTQK